MLKFGENGLLKVDFISVADAAWDARDILCFLQETISEESLNGFTDCGARGLCRVLEFTEGLVTVAAKGLEGKG